MIRFQGKCVTGGQMDRAKFIGPCLPSFVGSSKLTAATTYIHKSKKHKISFYEMPDKILESITFIKSVSKKKASFDKILAHLGKSVDGKGSWSPEGLHEELNNMTGENVREFVNGTYKIKPSQDNKITNDNNLTIFVEDTQHDSLEKTLQRFEEPDSVLADISSKRHHYHSQVGDSQIVVELLKNRVSSLEKQLIEKNAIIDFLLKEIRTLRLLAKQQGRIV